MRGSDNWGITVYTSPKSYPPNTGGKSPTGAKVLGGKSPVGKCPAGKTGPRRQACGRKRKIYDVAFKICCWNDVNPKVLLEI